MADANIGTLVGTISIKDEGSGKIAAFGANLAALDPKFNSAERATTSLGETFSQLGTKLTALGSKLQTAGLTLSASITAPIVALGVTSIAAGDQFISTMNRVQAVTEASASDFAALNAAAIEWGQKTQYSSAQAADAMLELGKAGFTTTQTIDALPATLQLAAAANMSLGDAANLTANVMKTFGLQTTDLARANDILAKAANSSTIEVSDMRESFKYVGPVAFQAGVGLAEASAAMALMGEAGIKGSMAGTTLRNVITTLETPTKKQAELMKELGIQHAYANGKLMEMPEILDRISASGADTSKVLELFGDRAGPGMAALVQKGSGALRDLTESLNNSEGAAKAMADAAMKGLPGAMEQLRGSIETAQIALVQALEPSLIAAANAVQRLADLVTSTLIPAFQLLPESLQVGAVALVGIATALGPIVLLGSGVAKVLGILATAAGGIIGVFTATEVAAAVAAPALTGAALATANATAAFEALFATAPVATVATAELATGFTAWAGASTILGGALTVLSGPVGWTIAAGTLLLTASGSWGSFFNILKYGALIISDIVVVAFGRLVEVGGTVVSFLGRLVGAAANATGVTYLFKQLGAGIGWVADRLEAFEFSLRGQQGPIDQAAKGLDTYHKTLTAGTLPAVQSADNALKLLNLQLKAGAAGLGTLTGPANLLVAGPLRSIVKATEEASEKSQTFEKAIETLQGKLSGTDLLSKAKEYEAVLKNIGGASTLTTKETGEVANAYTAVIEKYQQLGPAGAPIVTHFQTVLSALGPLPEKADAFAKAVESLRAKLSGSDLLTKGREFETVLDQIGGTSTLTGRELGDVIGTYIQLIDKFKLAGPAGADNVATFQALLSAVTPLPPVIAEATNNLNDLGTKVDLQMPLVNMRALTDSVEQLQREGLFAEASLKKMGATIGTLPNVKPSVDIAAWRREAENAGKTFTGAIEKTLQDMPGIFKQAFTGSGGVSGALKAILVDLGSQIGTWLTGKIAGSIASGVSGGSSGTTGSGTGLGTAATGAGVTGATAIGVSAAGITGAAATAGVTMGISLAVIGAIALYKAKAQPEWKKLGKDIGRDFGLSLSDETLKTFASQSSVIGRQATEIFNIDTLIKASGGLNSSNLDLFTGKLRDVFSMYQTGAFSAAASVKVLDDNWQAFADAGTDADGRLSKGLKEVIQLTVTSGLKTKEIATYMQGQGAAAISGFALVVKGAALDSRQALTDMGVQAVASISAAVAAGMSMPDALRAAGPALAQITSAYQTLGLGIDDAALRSLLFQSSILEANPDLIAAISGLSSEMIALDNLGLLNVETFGSMERTGAAMYTRLQAAAAAAGGSTRDALVPMQDWLRKAAGEAELLGVPLDDNTQSLINQSKELGIWKDTGKDATSKLTDGMQTLVDKVGELIDQLGRIPDVSFNITGKYNPPNIPATPDVPGFATGTRGQLVDFGPRGTLVTLHGKERVQTASEASAADRKIVDIAPLLAEQRRTRDELRGLRDFFTNRFDQKLARSVRDENQKASRR